MAAIKLIVAEDQEVVRAGLASLLAGEGIKIIAEATTGRQALAKTKRLKPDVLLMDVLMRDMDGLDSLERILKAAPKTKVIMMSAHDNPSYVARATAMGAGDFLRKDVPGKEFAAAIRRAVRGEAPPKDSPLAKMKAFLDERPDPKVGKSKVKLTRREYQVVRHIAYGLSNRELASSLGISIETVKEHVQNVLRKADLPDRTAVAVWAMKQGMI